MGFMKWRGGEVSKRGAGVERRGYQQEKYTK
jgi:hypothetical protein